MSVQREVINNPVELHQFLKDELKLVPSAFDYEGYPYQLQRCFLEKLRSDLTYVNASLFKIKATVGCVVNGVDYSHHLNEQLRLLMYHIRVLRIINDQFDKSSFRKLVSRMKYRLLRLVGKDSVVCL